MNVPEIQDWQFGQFRWDAGYYQAEVEWARGLMIGLWLRILKNNGDLNTIIERARIIFNSLRDRKDEFPYKAARELLESYNESLLADDKEPVDAQYIVDNMTLDLITIFPDGESTLTYITYVMPLIVVTISPDLSFKSALFD